ncbi:uncharacterized protein BJX67DRAFT_384850 [Aspergillus lucknowensis]|uniref:Uncharacterized protein n=1 Tax=Aspergillus lucknowensis TaxID=176173 RepID=A0ABR4LGL5_9EURO
MVSFSGKTIGIWGLWLDSSSPNFVKWSLKECITEMRTIQLFRKKRSVQQNIDMYGLVTSGDLVQFHKLSDAGEVQSSSIFLLTAEGLPVIWSYLRNIIHAIQLDAPQPQPLERGPFDYRHNLDRMLLTYRWELNPDGTPLEKHVNDGKGDERAGRRAANREIIERRYIRSAELTTRCITRGPRKTQWH